VALLVVPSAVAWILVGTSLDTPAGLLVARVAGSALSALGIACALSADKRRVAAIALIVPLLGYNVAVAGLLVYARLVAELSGIGLWAALHAALAGWCVGYLTRYRGTGGA
jgi:hypothetical protein